MIDVWVNGEKKNRKVSFIVSMTLRMGCNLQLALMDRFKMWALQGKYMAIG